MIETRNVRLVLSAFSIHFALLIYFSYSHGNVLHSSYWHPNVTRVSGALDLLQSRSASYLSSTARRLNNETKKSESNLCIGILADPKTASSLSVTSASLLHTLSASNRASIFVGLTPSNPLAFEPVSGHINKVECQSSNRCSRLTSLQQPHDGASSSTRFIDYLGMTAALLESCLADSSGFIVLLSSDVYATPDYFNIITHDLNAQLATERKEGSIAALHSAYPVPFKTNERLLYEAMNDSPTAPRIHDLNFLYIVHDLLNFPISYFPILIFHFIVTTSIVSIMIVLVLTRLVFPSSGTSSTKNFNRWLFIYLHGAIFTSALLMNPLGMADQITDREHYLTAYNPDQINLAHLFSRSAAQSYLSSIDEIESNSDSLGTNSNVVYTLRGMKSETRNLSGLTFFYHLVCQTVSPSTIYSLFLREWASAYSIPLSSVYPSLFQHIGKPLRTLHFEQGSPALIARGFHENVYNERIL